MTQLAFESQGRDDHARSHVEFVRGLRSASSNGKSVVQRATGRFYTHELIGRHLAREIATILERSSRAGGFTAVDPFCGDGRLIVWLLQETHRRLGGSEPWAIELWDCDDEAVRCAVDAVEAEAARLGRTVTVRGRVWDTFAEAPALSKQFDVVITNPPWEQVKPDRREISLLHESDRADYVQSLKSWSRFLETTYPAARPRQRFAGWGMNLARVGTDVAMRLTTPDGLCGVVSPASFLADTNSETLREALFDSMSLLAVAYFPAEARLFEGVDVPCVGFVAQGGVENRAQTEIARFGPERSLLERRHITLDLAQLRGDGWVVPVSFGAAGIELLEQINSLPRFGDLEDGGSLWAGRELDETGKERYLSPHGTRPFAKGVNVRRFGIASDPDLYVDERFVKLPRSVEHPRLVWRDVSRPNQKRRVHATLIPPGWVTGNSLGVAYDRSDDWNRLAALLAVFNSFVFEFQLRASLSTGHISLSSVRRARLPSLSREDETRFAELALLALDGREGAETTLEVEVARAYGLDASAWTLVLDSYPKVTSSERELLASAWQS